MVALNNWLRNGEFCKKKIFSTCVQKRRKIFKRPRGTFLGSLDRSAGINIKKYLSKL